MDSYQLGSIERRHSHNRKVGFTSLILTSVFILILVAIATAFPDIGWALPWIGFGYIVILIVASNRKLKEITDDEDAFKHGVSALSFLNEYSKAQLKDQQEISRLCQRASQHKE